MPNLFGMHCINPVGRYFNEAVYVHKDYAHLIPNKIDMKILEARMKELPTDFDYDLIRYDRFTLVNVSFISSPNFDDASDPLIGDSWYIKDPELIRRGVKHRHTNAKKDIAIRHHKWVYVTPDYKGFDWDEAMRWSEKWLSRVHYYNVPRSLSKWVEFLKKHKLPCEYGLKDLTVGS